MKKALCIGINHYDHAPDLKGCINDASGMAEVLKTDFDDSPNVEVETYTSDQQKIDRDFLSSTIRKFFEGFEAKDDVALFFFAGHGHKNNMSGYLAAQDGTEENPGFDMSYLISLTANCRAKEILLIFDCCHSGYGGTPHDILSQANMAQLRAGTTILTASLPTEYAWEGKNGHGMFSETLINGLKGGAADLTGSITGLSLYNYAKRYMGDVKQKPMFKANISDLYTIRRALPAIEPEVLATLTTYFKHEGDSYQLDPEHEPDIANATEVSGYKPDPKKTAIFAHLQVLRGVNMLKPDKEEHMYYAALREDKCSLTELGKVYWNMVNRKMI